MVRIRFPPAGSLQTFSSSRAATAMAKPDSSHSRTGSSNPVPSCGESVSALARNRKFESSSLQQRVLQTLYAPP